MGERKAWCVIWTNMITDHPPSSSVDMTAIYGQTLWTNMITPEFSMKSYGPAGRKSGRVQSGPILSVSGRSVESQLLRISKFPVN